MLYKKYHRSFIKQLKKGVRFRVCGRSTIYLVIDEPIVAGDKLQCISVKCWDNLKKYDTSLYLWGGRLIGIIDKITLII